MAFVGNNLKVNTSTLVPQSAQPSNPTEGMIYYDDGTVNTEGVYKYQNGAWEFIGSLVDHLKLNPLSADPSTPVTGQTYYSDGTAREAGLWVYDGTFWQPVGRNTGSLDYFYSENFESVQLSDIVTTGTITKALETANPIASVQSAKLTQVSGSLGATASLGNIDLELAQKGTTIGYQGRYTYDGNSNDIDFIIEDVTNSVELGRVSLKAASDVATFRLIVNTQSTTNQIAYKFEVMTENIGAVLIFDNIEGRTNPLPTVESVESQNIRFQERTGMGSTATKIPYFTNVSAEYGSGLFSYTNDSTNGLVITIEKDCIINGGFSCDSLGGFTFAGFSLNASSVTFDLPDLVGSEILCIDYARGTSTIVNASASFEYRASAGDVIRPHSSANAPSDAANWSVNISAKATSANVVFEGQKKSNSYPITIDQTSGTAVVLNDDFGIVESVTTVGTGQAQINFKSELFANTPHIVSGMNAGTPNDRSVQINNVSNTDFRYTMFASNGSVVNHIANFTVTAQGSDYVDEFLYSVPVTNEVENTYTVKIQNNGSVSIKSSGAVSFVDADVTLNATGDITLDTSRLGMTQTPLYDVQPFFASASNGRECLIISESATSIRFVTQDSNSGTNVNVDVSVTIKLQGADYKAPKGYFLGNLSQPKAKLNYRVASGGTGGSGTSSTYVTRNLNNIESDLQGIVTSLSSNRFTLKEGTYEIKALAEGVDCVLHKAKLVQDPGGSPIDAIIGTSAYSDSGGGVQSVSVIDGIVTISSTTEFEIQHYVSLGSGTDTFGLATSDGSDEVYLPVTITKLR